MKGLLNDPTLAMGIGLLSGAQPGGTFAGGMQNALQMGQQARQQNLKDRLVQAKLMEYQREQEEAERRRKALQGMIGQQGQYSAIAPGSDAELQAFGQPNTATNVGGTVQMDQAPTGLFAQSPQLAGLLQALPAEDAAGLLGKMYMQQMEPQDPTSAMQNYQYLLAQGVPEPEARQGAFGKMTINVGESLPYDVPKNHMLVDPKDPSKGVRPIPGGPKDVQATPRSSTEATQISNARSAIKDLEVAKKMLFTPSGELRRKEAASMTLGGVPGTSGRSARQSLRRAIETILRARSGAAVPPEEVNNYMELYAPSMFDEDVDAGRKIKRLEEFFNQTLDLLKAGPRESNAVGAEPSKQEEPDDPLGIR